MMRPVAIAAGVFACVVFADTSAFGQTVTLATNGGITITGTTPLWSTSFGSVNGL